MKRIIALAIATMLVFVLYVDCFANDAFLQPNEPIINLNPPVENEIKAFSKGSEDLPQNFVDEYGNHLGRAIVRYTWKYDKEGKLAYLTGKTLYSYPASSNYRISANYSNVTSTSFYVTLSFVDNTGAIPSQYYTYQVIVHWSGGSSQILIS